MVTSDEKSLESIQPTGVRTTEHRHFRKRPSTGVKASQSLEGINLVSNYTVKDDKEVAVNDVKSGMD